MKSTRAIPVLSAIAVTAMFAGSVYAQNFKGNAQPNDDTVILKKQVEDLQRRISQLEQGSAGDDLIFPRHMWQPFAELEALQRSMTEVYNPRLDIKESPERYTITMDVPGMDKNNIDVKVQDHSLIISGERTHEVKEENPGRFSRYERGYGHFMRAVPLPKDALTDKVDAKYDNGVLTVQVGRAQIKADKPAAQKIPVK